MRVHLLIITVLLAMSMCVTHARSATMMIAFAANGVSDAGAAARAAAGASGGRVLDVQTRQSGEQPVYDVKVLLDDGRVRIIQIDGQRPPVPDARSD